MGAEDLRSLLTPFRDAALHADPDLVHEIDGMATGADAAWWDLFAVNAFEELEPLVSKQAAAPVDRCTAFAVRTQSGATLLAHNEQWVAGDSHNVIVIVSRPDEGPAFVSPTVACCLPAVGMNGAGVAQAIMSLTADDDGVGIPRVLTSRRSLQADQRDMAVQLSTRPGRAGGYAHLFATGAGDIFTVETSARRHSVTGDRSHTNHYLDSALAEPAPSPRTGSIARLTRLRQLLERPPETPEECMQILADHGSDPKAICMHPEPEDDEDDAIVFSMVCDVTERRMWVSAGNPCTEPFEEIDLAEALT